ncbi:MAG: recombinase family protein [Bacteroidales bacterium]|nr:recombinase family protein [Bacteroidales bacterium]
MKKTDVAAYIRVSTASDAQTHSYEYQESYWRDVLREKPGNNFVGIYADLGISGRSMRKRPQFTSMVEDCRKGLIKKIYVKSVSRFSRNTVELLDMVRQLREMNVAVYFEQEKIDTLRSTSDVELTIAAAVADADLQRYSENQKWSIAYKYANGIIAVGNKIYGYEMTKENDLVPIPEEAKRVEQIFELYLQGLSIEKIAAQLNSEGVKTVRGLSKWSSSTINNMLRNERYIGDSVQHKFVKQNGVRYRNKGGALKKQLYIENSHQPIIGRETFNKVQEELKNRTNPKLLGHANELHEFTGLIECGVCGKKFIHKINNAGTPWQTEFWNCSKKLKEGKAACGSNGIKDGVIREKFVEAFNCFIEKGFDNAVVETAKKERDRLVAEECQLKTVYANGYILKTHYDTAAAELLAKIKEQEKTIQKFKIKNVTERDYTPVTEYDPVKFDKFISGISIKDWEITFRFINGVEITKPYTNGQHGNIKDWIMKKEEIKEDE